MKLSDGLFLKSIRAVAEKYPDIEYKELIVDNACMQMVLKPSNMTCYCCRIFMAT